MASSDEENLEAGLLEALAEGEEQDLLNAAQTCRQLRTASSDQLIWHRLYRARWPRDDDGDGDGDTDHDSEGGRGGEEGPWGSGGAPAASWKRQYLRRDARDAEAGSCQPEAVRGLYKQMTLARRVDAPRDCLPDALLFAATPAAGTGRPGERHGGGRGGERVAGRGGRAAAAAAAAAALASGAIDPALLAEARGRPSLASRLARYRRACGFASPPEAGREPGSPASSPSTGSGAPADGPPTPASPLDARARSTAAPRPPPSRRTRPPAADHLCSQWTRLERDAWACAGCGRLHVCDARCELVEVLRDGQAVCPVSGQTFDWLLDTSLDVALAAAAAGDDSVDPTADPDNDIGDLGAYGGRLGRAFAAGYEAADERELMRRFGARG